MVSKAKVWVLQLTTPEGVWYNFDGYRDETIAKDLGAGIGATAGRIEVRVVCFDERPESLPGQEFHVCRQPHQQLMRPNEWRAEVCGAPLSDAERKEGLCAICRKGWTHPDDYPAKVIELPAG